MAWFKRQAGSGDDRESEPHVASDLAKFLAQSTEWKALMQAIGDAQSHPDKPTATATGRDVPSKG
jgi:hypothetical protein